jgi:hypothetical protein
MKFSFLAFLVWFSAVLVQTSTAQIPRSNHVVVVVEENHGYSSVIGSGAMPYLNSLANQYGLATTYYANTHPSIGNYFMMTTGQIITNDDGYSQTVTADNLVRHMLSAGLTWKSYAESLPYVGYTGGDSGAYLRHHNPFSYFSDVKDSSVQKLNLVPFTQFATDLHNQALPHFSFIVPNVNHDAHNGTLQQADAWLQSNIAPLLSSSAFRQDGILIVVFDEASSSDRSHGGGHVAAVVVGPKVTSRTRSATFYQHQNLLRTVGQALGLTTFPGAAASATPMSDFFSRTSYGVTVTSPVDQSIVASSVHFVASARSDVPIEAMAIYVDDNLKWKHQVASLDTYLTLAAGNRHIVVQAWDTSQKVYKTSLYVTVR